VNDNNIKYKLNPYWVTGLIDGEGCFYVIIAKSKNHKIGWWVQACFQLGLHVKDKDLLLQIKSFFNETGSIYAINKNKALLYQVRNLNEITKEIIPHFENYSLITQKQSDFLLFKEIIKLMNKNEHLTEDGLVKIINLKASLNKGLSNKLKIFFPNVITITRPKSNLLITINYNWISGFFSGEDCFSIGIYKSNTNKIDYGITLHISITQNYRDKLLIDKLMNTLNCGIVSKNYKNNMAVLNIYKFKDIYNIIIPLFNQYNIKGVKSLDFQDFCKVANLINEKTHLTIEGLKEISTIKINMNKGRKLQKEKLL
jgi:LAGLIDADG endonuclease